MNEKQENRKWGEKLAEFYKKEICPLTDSKECEKAVENYKDNKDETNLMDDIFEALKLCESEKCILNEKLINEKLKKWNEENKES